MLKNFTLFKLW